MILRSLISPVGILTEPGGFIALKLSMMALISYSSVGSKNM